MYWNWICLSVFYYIYPPIQDHPIHLFQSNHKYSPQEHTGFQAGGEKGKKERSTVNHIPAQ